MSSAGLLKRIKNLLKLIYSKETSDHVFPALKNLMDLYRGDERILNNRKIYNDRVRLDEKDAFLITYADTIYGEGEKPLRTLHRFLRRHVKNAVSGVHILPFFPSSSDAGYAVIDYEGVDPALGTWEDIRNISQDYRLMVDLVLNHVSSRSEWFLGSRNYHKGVNESGVKRMINREKLPEERIHADLSHPQSLRFLVLKDFLHLLNARRQIVPFHPAGAREVVDSDRRLLVIRRTFQGGTILVIINVSEDEIMFPDHKGKFDHLTRTAFDGRVEAYGIYFLDKNRV